MTDDFRDIESELESLRPVEPSAGLREAVARRIEAEERRVLRFPALLGIGAAAVAACLAVAVVVWRPARPGREMSLIGPRPVTGPATTATVAPVRPALGVYAKALSRSPDALDQLLDRQAAEVGAPAGPSRPWVVGPELTN